MADPALLHEGWRGELRLGFRRRGARTVLSERRHRGPLLVQRPFYPEADGTCHAYLLHPPGGVVGGDRLFLGATLRPESRAVITTPGANKLYRSEGHGAVVDQRLVVGRDAALEWLPQETIAFAGSRARLRTRVDLVEGGRFLGWEVLCLGRPAVGEGFGHGGCRQELEIWREGRPLLLERASLTGGSGLLQGPWGLHGQPVTATFAAVPGGPEAVALARGVLGAPSQAFTVTLLDDVLVARYRGPDAGEARQGFQALWAALRPGLLGRPPVAPRIWRT
ncbi:hypothetical protein AN478_07145 [Thiohalorhabdus denitrificans]|uniref:Urease accessory protein UreD n=1 Tax=Thiohalorhabdus denitrificans TaxID=381306 RepID=A0A0P9ECI9_9GAMM|nr:urease accessory protein UreD [Thiohalorhabdus denitrificans]KPV39959.1 hypothetical protein AN478_07145 [Thiohalorhabdus denitrificans]SCY09868.1 urease accessory protein [Thiohalorhabdus denitrificans]